MSPHSSRQLNRYGLALLLVAIAVGIRLLLDPILGDQMALLLFLLPVSICATVGGFGPGLVATLVSALVGLFLFLDPRYSFDLTGQRELMHVIVFLLVGSVISWLGEQRLRTIEAMRARDERFRAFMDNAPMIAFIKERGGRYVYGNLAWARQFGKRPEELLGRTDFDLWPPESAELFKESDEAAFSSATPVETIETATDQLGRTRSWWLIKFPLEGEPGRQMLGGLVLDLTKQKEIEKELAERREWLRVTLSSIGDAVIATDTEGRVNFMNPIAEELTGWTLADAHDRPLTEVFSIINEQSRKPVENPLRKVMRSGLIIGLPNHTLLCARDGRERPIADSGAPIRDRDGKIIGLVLVFRDVTEQRQAEKARRESEESLRLVLEATEDGIWDWDIESGRIWFSPRWYASLGYSQREIEKSPATWDRLIHPDDLPRMRRLLDDCLAGKVPFFESENRWLAKNGEWRWKLDRGRVVARGDESRPLRMVGASIEISERKRVEEERHQLEQQLYQAQKMETLGTLAGGIAHDFNNLLTAIIGNIQLARLSLDDRHPANGALGNAEAAGNRATALTRQLLAFSRRQPLERRTVDLGALLTNLAKILNRVLGERVEMNFHLAPDLSPILADPGQVEQIIMNLVVNARDAMPDGGRIEIETANARMDEDFIRHHHWAVAGDYVKLSVSDTGCGMSEEVKSRIFEPFFTTKEVGKGTGLGLPVVYGIVKQHNGLIQVYSEPGHGTTIQIYLPVATEGAESEVEVTPARVAGGDETILVAEDEESVRDLAYSLLGSLGYRVLTARDGKEALDLWKEHGDEIDLLLLDVVMPRLGGLEVYEKLRDAGVTTPVLFATGYSAEIVKGGFQAIRGASLIQKPYTLDGLGRKIRELLDDGAGRESGD